MNHWLQASEENLLPLSVAKLFREALKEWFFTGEVFDHIGEDMICELCDHQDLAHHFEIKNKLTDKALLVGSSCILKFQEIEIFDSLGSVTDDEEYRKIILEDALKKKIRAMAVDSLRQLWRADYECRDRIKDLGLEVKGRALAPDDLIFLFERMALFEVEYHAARYRVSLRSELEQYRIARLSQEKIEKIWPSLSFSQRKRVRELNKRFVM